MKARATLLAIPVMLGVAFAQQQSGSQGQQGTSGQTQSGSQQTGASGQTSATTGAQTTGMAEMKTSTFKGTLVDLACGGASASAAGSGQSDTATTAKSTASEAGATAGGSMAGHTGTAGASGAANRSASDGSGCPVTANSTQLGMKLDKTGQVVRFDLVGNQRAMDALKTNKGWNKNLTANKPIKASISGVLQGDKLIVSSIH